MDGITPIEQRLPSTADPESSLPPFRSAREFPVSPRPEKLPELYVECRKALVDANTARTLLRERMAKKKEVINSIRAEIDRLEMDLAIEASTRLKLHAMNEQLVGALREMEKIAEEVSSTISAAHGGKRTGLKGLIDQLKALVRSWRSFKASQRLSIANPLPRGQDDETSS